MSSTAVPLKLHRVPLALGLIGLGLVSLVYRDFALQWQPVPTWVPLREILACASGVVLLGTGVGLLWQPTAAASSRVLLPYLVLWFVLLKLPHVVDAPLVEVNWLGAGEIAVILSAGWILYALLRGETKSSSVFAMRDRTVRIASLMFGVALIPIGLSHFVYVRQTIGFVPTWLPYRAGWAYLGGAGHLAAGAGVLLGIRPRLAAMLEAAMIGVFTLLVWLPAVAAAPTNRLQWTGFLMSWTIGAAAFVVAGGMRSLTSDPFHRTGVSRSADRHS